MPDWLKKFTVTVKETRFIKPTRQNSAFHEITVDDTFKLPFNFNEAKVFATRKFSTWPVNDSENHYLTTIFNTPFETGVFPNDLKSAIVSPSLYLRISHIVIIMQILIKYINGML